MDKIDDESEMMVIKELFEKLMYGVEVLISVYNTESSTLTCSSFASTMSTTFEQESQAVIAKQDDLKKQIQIPNDYSKLTDFISEDHQNTDHDHASMYSHLPPQDTEDRMVYEDDTVANGRCSFNRDIIDTEISQELEDAEETGEKVLKIEMSDVATEMSQGFLQQQLRNVDKCDTATTSMDLFDMTDASTWMDMDDEKMFSISPPCNQLVPERITDVITMRENSENNDGHDFYGAKKQRFEDLRKANTSLDHMVPDVSGEHLMLKRSEPVFRHKVAARNASLDTTASASPKDLKKTKQLKNTSRFYEYYEDDKENINPDDVNVNNNNNEFMDVEDEETAGNTITIKSSKSITKPIQPYIVPPSATQSSGILRLGLSRRSRPSKNLHNPTSLQRQI